MELIPWAILEVMPASRRGSRRWFDALDSFYFESVSAITQNDSL